MRVTPWAEAPPLCAPKPTLLPFPPLQMTTDNTDTDVTKRDVKNQLGPAEKAHVTGAVSAKEPDLRWLVEEAGATGIEEVIDVAPGTGHASLVLSPHVRHITTLTPSPSALSLHTANITHLPGSPTSLPFPAHSADLVLCCYAAHRLSDPTAALLEAHRVLRPLGRLLLVDTVSPEQDDLNAFLNGVEAAREPGHVRNYRLSEWLEMLGEANFDNVEIPHIFGLAVGVPGHAGTVEPTVGDIGGMLERAEEETKEHFEIVMKESGEWTFKVPVAMFVARAREGREKEAETETKAETETEPEAKTERENGTFGDDDGEEG